MKKVFLKRWIVLFLSLIMVMTIIPLSTINAKAATVSYNPSTAVNYSYDHVYTDKSWKCAEYVSRCMNAGGASFTPEAGVLGLYNKLGTFDNFTKYTLSYTPGVSTLSANGNNSGKVAVGDVIIIRGKTRGYLHAVIVSKIDSKGNVYYNGHNEYKGKDSAGNAIWGGTKDGAGIASYTSGSYSGENGTIILDCFHYTGTTKDTVAPTVTNLNISVQTSEELRWDYTVYDNVGITKTVYTYYRPQPIGNKVSTYDTGTSNGDYYNRIRNWNSSDYPDGYYWLTIEVWDAAGNKGSATSAKALKDTTGPTGSNIQVSNVSSEGYTVTLNVSDNFSGVSYVYMPTWTEYNGQDDLAATWPIATLSGNTASYYVKTSDHNNEHGEYITHVYAKDGKGNQAFVGSVSVKPVDSGSPMDEGYGRTIPDGDYLIANAGTLDKSQYYYLDIEGTALPAENGTNVSLCGPAGQMPSSADIWTIKYEKDGFYSIKQKGTNQCLDVYKSGNTEGTNVQTWDFVGSDNQLWAIVHNEYNGYTIKAKHSSFLLTVNATNQNGSNVTTNDRGSKDYQAWMFIPYKPEQKISNGNYVIASTMDDNCVMTIDSNSKWIKMDYVYNSDINNHTFSLTKLDNGYYRILDSNGKSLNLINGESEPKERVVLSTSNGSFAQQWAIEESGANKYGYGYTITPSSSGLPIDYTPGMSIMYIYQNVLLGSKNQYWKIVPASYSVKYDMNGGSGSIADQTKYYKAGIILSKTVPQRSGYTFLGWSTSKTATYETYVSGDTYREDSNVTLYAVWKKVENSTIPTDPSPTDPSPTDPSPSNPSPSNPSPSNPSDVNEDKVTAFVKRIYSDCLGRTPETSGVQYWTNELVTGSRDGASVGAGFVFSEEYMNKGVSQKEYVKMLYKVFMGREADESGLNYWISKMNNGMTREEVFQGFVYSNEYTQICASYGINRGEYVLQGIPDPVVKNGEVTPAITNYVERIYVKALNRQSDPSGIAYWSQEIANGSKDPVWVAELFIFSEEFESKNLDNAEYIKVLYRTFMGREADNDGLYYWLTRLQNGESRKTVLESFAGCPEFQDIIKSFGL